MGAFPDRCKPPECAPPGQEDASSCWFLAESNEKKMYTTILGGNEVSETGLGCGSIPSIPTKNQMHLTFPVYEKPEKNGLLLVFNHSSLGSKAPTG